MTRPPLTEPSDTILADTSGVLAPPGHGSIAVNDRGQALGHIPIWVPPGRNGIQPKLSLEYSSGAGNGVLGTGWQLAGLPRITRCPSLRKNGAVAAPIEWNEGDSFCLDGEPLWADSDHYMYYPFHWDGSRIWRDRTSFADPGSWEMRTKDGRIITFGATTDSRLMVQRSLPGPRAMTWAVSRIEDRSGNFMTVTYDTSAGGDLRPTRIDYTGSASDPTTHRSVTFTYDSSRRDIDQRMFAEQNLTYPDRLASIEMHAPNSANLDPLRSVSFGYTTSATTGRSLLKYVAECAGGPRTSLPVTGSVPLCRQQTFDYAPGVPLTAANAYAPGSYDSNGLQIGDVSQFGVQGGVLPTVELLDVDGDGRDDLLYLSNDAGQTYHLRLSQGTAFGPAIATGIPATTTQGLPESTAGASAPLVLDFNGDGHADIIVNQGETTPYYRPQARLYLANNASGSWTLGGPGYEFQLFASAPIYSDVQTADLDGDGRPDLVMSAGASAYYALNTDGTVAGLSPVAPMPSQEMANYTDSLTNYYADLNNDGVTDLMTRMWSDSACKGQKTGDLTCDCSKIGFGVLDVGAHLYSSYDNPQPATSEKVTGLKYCRMVDLGGYPTYGHLFGDFNGDGVVDVIETFVPHAADGTELPMQLQLLLGGGQQSFSKQFGPGQLAIANPYVSFKTLDADGDGKTDLLVRSGGTTPYTVYSYKDQAWPAMPPKPLLLGEPAVVYAVDQGAFATGDVDGDGQSDFVALDGNGEIVLYRRYSAGPRPDLLTATRGDFTPATTVTYQPYHPAPDEDRSDCVWPLACVSRAGYLVSEVDTDNGIGGTNAQYHAYAGGRADPLGWGFLGFKTHTITDGVTGRVTKRTFDFTRNTAGGTPFYPFAGHPTEVDTTIVYKAGGKHVTRTTTVTNQYEVRGTGPIMVHPILTHSQTADSNSPGLIDERITSRTFDDYGDQTYERVQMPLVLEERDTSTTYLDQTATWIIGRPTYVSTKSSTNVTTLGGTSVTRDVAYTYDAAGLLAVEIDNPGAANGASYDPLPPQDDGVQTLYTRITRDANGLPHVIEKLDNLATPTQDRTTTLDHDTSEGMFVVQTTDPANLVTQAVYDPGLGVVAAQTDAAGLPTTFQYDTFGRIRADHPAAGGDRTVAYHAGGTIDDHRAGHYNARTTLDSLRRTIQTTTTGRADGKAVQVDTTYDALGRTRTVSRPHFAGVTPARTVTTYDNLGRVTEVQGADGSTTTSSYLGRTVTTTNPDGNVSVVTNDALGRPVTSVQTIAPGQTTTTTLAYGPFDTLSTSTDTLGNVVSHSYDRLARELWKKSADSGVTAHAYDVFGEVSHEIRGASLVAIMLGGHLHIHVTGGIATQMTYDGDGRVLTKATDDITQTFHYDDVMPGKLSNVSITGGPTIAYTYVASGNGAGNVETKTWAGPRGAIGYRYAYDSYGRVATTAYPKLSDNRKSLVVGNTYSGGDIGGQLTKVDDITTATPVTYWTLSSTDASEQFPVARLRNDVTSALGEDPSHPGWLYTIVGKQGTTTIQHLRYTREGGGRVAKREDLASSSSPVTETFGYDGLERLTSWSWAGAAGARGVQYVYDELGNLRQRNITAGPGTSVTYTPGTYPFGPHQTASDSLGTTYHYDAQGNQTEGPGRSFTWSSFGRATSVTSSAGTFQLVYDAEIARFSRSDPSGHTRYSYGGLFDEFSDASGTHDVLTITANGKPVGEKEITDNAVSSAKRDALLVDALGSIDTIVTSTGRQAIKYDPFGTRVTATDPTVRITTPPQDLRAGFTGHHHDDDVDLVDMIGRVYDPVQQRFLSVDPPAPDPVDSQAYNPYAYVRNNPLNATDPTGYLEVLLDGLHWKDTPADIYGQYVSGGSAEIYGLTFRVAQGTDGTDGTGLPVLGLPLLADDGLGISQVAPVAIPDVQAEAEDAEVDPTVAKTIENADAVRDFMGEFFERHRGILAASGLDEGFLERLKIGGYALAAISGYNTAAERGDDALGRATAALTSALTATLDAPGSLIGSGATLLGTVSPGNVRGGLTQVAGATLGGALPGAMQFALQAGRTLTHESIPEADHLLNSALHGGYTPIIQNASVIGQALAGNGNLIMDEAPTGALGGPARWGDGLGDWLGRTLPCNWCVH